MIVYAEEQSYVTGYSFYNNACGNTFSGRTLLYFLVFYNFCMCFCDNLYVGYCLLFNNNNVDVQLHRNTLS